MDCRGNNTFTRSDRDLVAGRRGAANQLGFAVQLALLRHSGTALAQMEDPIDVLVEWLARGWDSCRCLRRLRRPAADDDGPRADAGGDVRLATARQRRPAFHDRGGGAVRLGHRSRRADCRRRHRGAAGRKVPSSGAGGHRAYRHCWARSGAQTGRRRAALGPFPGATGQARCAAHSQPGARGNAARMAAECSDRRQSPIMCGRCSIGSAASAKSASPEAAGRIHEDRFQQLIREGRISDAHQIGRYAALRRRAILVASIIDLEAWLTTRYSIWPIS